MNDSEVSPVEDLTGLQWRDDVFLGMGPLHQHNVMDYFARSPFYSAACNNEECKRLGLGLDKLHTMKPGGIEYVLTACQEPVLYVIKRQQRLAPDRTRQEAFYYVLHGSVYMAPCLHTCITSRLKRCLYSLDAAFGQLRHDLEPLEWKERHRRKRVCKAQALAERSKGAKPAEDAAAGKPGDVADSSKAQLKAEAEGTTKADAPTSASHDAHQYIVPQAAPTAAHIQWLRQTDQVLLSVLSRYEIPTFPDQLEDASKQPAVASETRDVKPEKL